MIQPEPGWYPPDSPAYPSNPIWGQVANYWVLEDGTEYTAGDFGTATVLSSSLYTAFGLGAVTTAVNVDSTGKVAFYTATAANLGSLQPTVANLTTSGLFSTPPGVVGVVGYQVVMDRDKARVFAFNYVANLWVPVLWVDRFGHSVTFQWGGGTVAPSGYSAVSWVIVKNNRGNGLQAQWVTCTTQTAVPLLRVDFINVQAPTLQVTGYSGYAAHEPAALGGGGFQSVNNPDMVPLRPTEVQIGNPTGDMPTPVWMYAGLSQPSQTTFKEPWPADQVWTYTYDANNAEVESMTNPMGVTTAFTWTTTNLYSLGYANTNLYRSISSAVSTDARTGVVLTQNYTWNLPTTATTSVPWTSTLTQTYSGTGVVTAATAATTTTYTFASPSTNPNYNNAAMTNIAVACGSTQLSNMAITLPSSSATMLGVDQTLSSILGQHAGGNAIRSGKLGMSLGVAKTYPMGDTPALTTTTVYVSNAARPFTITNSSANFQDVTTFTYDSHPELLDPNRVIQTDYQRTSGGSNYHAPSRQTAYNATTFLPTTSCLFDSVSNSKIGQNFTAYDSGGHLTTATNFASGSLFSTLTNTATSTWTVDTASGLPTNLAVTYVDPATGGPWTDTYSQAWPLASYDTADRPQVATDGLGVTTNLFYDALGRVTDIQKGGQADITTSYPNFYTTTSVQNGLTTTSVQDGFGHLMTRLRGNDGVTESYTIDSNGKTVQMVETPPSGTARITGKGYDARGRLTSMTPPIGPVVSYAYSVASTGAFSGDQVISATYSGQTFTSSKTIDQWGQTLSATDPMGTVTTAIYDAMGHATTVSVTPSGGTAQPRTFVYNALGFLTSKAEPETGTQTFSAFESHGLPTSITEGGGRNRTMVYDGLGRLRKVTGGSDSQTFNYNGLENATFATTSGGMFSSVLYGYDAFGRINSETVSPPSGPNRLLQYSYDAAGRLSTITYPDNKIATYTYDIPANFGRVTSVTFNGSTLATVGTGSPSTEYDGWGNLLTLAFGSGAKNAWAYSSNGLQITSQTITPLGGPATIRPYAYDALNHLTQAGEWSQLSHDPLGRLLSVTGMGLSETFAHDGYTNDTSAMATGTVPSAFNNFNFNPFPSDQTPALATNGAVTGWTYNGNGDASTMGSAIGASAPSMGFAWDGLGRLSSTTLSGDTETYAYLPSGMRVNLFDANNPGNNRQFVYSSGGKLLSEYTWSGGAWSWKGDIIYLGSLAIAEYDNAGIHELHSDHLGSPRIITQRATGAVEGVQAFGPYGEAMGSVYTNGYQPMTGYTGHVQTDPTGLIYMRGRFYSPAWHRFVNSDQGADPNQANQSAYCGGSPMMRTDPTGMSFWNDMEADDTRFNTGAAYSSDCYADGMYAGQAVGNAPLGEYGPGSTGSSSETASYAVLTLDEARSLGYTVTSYNTMATLVSRPIDTSDMPWYEAFFVWLSGGAHSGWILQTEQNYYYLIQSGNNGNGTDEAGTQVFGSFDSAVASFSEGAKAILPVTIISQGYANLSDGGGVYSLEQAWNNQNIPYALSGATCNTFSHWLDNKIQYYSPTGMNYLGIFGNWLLGWNYKAGN